jgi:peptide/nickel transport system permease protein
VTAITHNLPNAAGDEPLPEKVLEEPPQSMSREAWKRLRQSKVSMACLIIVALYLLIGLISFLRIFDVKIEQQFSPDKTYAPPALRYVGADGVARVSPAVWFGLDFQGRSVFWRVLYGTRVALIITICASVLSIGIGMVLGVLAGYFGGWVDDAITWLLSTVSSIPWLLLVIAVSYFLKEGSAAQATATSDLVIIILALGLTDWVSLCRLMRGEVIKLRDRDFVVAARAVGMGHGRIVFRHIIPNTVHLIIITFSLGAVAYVQVEVILAFLGIGVSSKPSWGRMIDDAKLALLRGVWWELAAATIAIFILSLALNLLGDALRDALDPRLRGVE